MKAITVEKVRQGYYVFSCVYKGYLRRQKYMGYTKAQAKVMFNDYLRSIRE